MFACSAQSKNKKASIPRLITQNPAVDDGVEILSTALKTSASDLFECGVMLHTLSFSPYNFVLTVIPDGFRFIFC